jgi:hypothetical protein
MRQLSIALLAFGFLVSASFALAQAPAAKQSVATPSAAARKLTYPPIPNPGFNPPRPMDQARAVYQFAAEHPEVLKYVPCYCGCESNGHAHNESCFVKRRDQQGNVTEWDTHGFGCVICLDVAREAMMMYRSGADPVSIRAAIEKKWTPTHQTKTPTPFPVPKKK